MIIDNTQQGLGLPLRLELYGQMNFFTRIALLFHTVKHAKCICYRASLDLKRLNSFPLLLVPADLL